MLEATFQISTGIDWRMERRLWRSGIKRWQDLLDLGSHPHISKRHLRKLKKKIMKYKTALKNENFEYFLTEIPSGLVWRAFPNLIRKILYFDVEATGLNKDEDEITTISTYDGENIRCFVNGDNLSDFPDYADEFSAICTFDGERLDIPLINKQLGYYFSHIHFDLFQLSRILGVRGGLKKIERRMGVDRDPLIKEINGKSAIFLWKEYQKSRDNRFLETLLAYNIEDVIHLEEMLYLFYNELRKKYRLPVARIRYPKKDIENPKNIYSITIKTINSKYFPEQKVN